MVRKLALTLLLSAFVATPSFAAPCRDAHGKFIKCAQAAAKAPVHCKDAKGKFVKCGTPGAKPA